MESDEDETVVAETFSSSLDVSWSIFETSLDDVMTELEDFILFSFVCCCSNNTKTLVVKVVESKIILETEVIK